ATRKVGDNRLGIGALDLQHTVERQDARLLGRLLRVHATIEQPVNEMRMADRLIVPAHDPEWHYRTTVLDQHARDDRVERPFARRNRVGMAWDRAEPGAAVVQQDAALRRQDPGAKGREQRVDEGAGVALAINRAEIDRILVLDLGPARSGHGAV